MHDSLKFKYDFFVKDHLGNTRAVVTSDVSTSVNDYMVTIDHLADYEASKSKQVLDVVPYKQFGAATHGLQTWASESKQRLQAIRRQIQ